MNCSTVDVKAYALGEAGNPGDAAHIESCVNCREELERLQATHAALLMLPEEEIPRRIAFVSDKVFEPRWWQRVFNPNFAAACVIAGAILVHAFARPAPSEALVQARIDAAVGAAVNKAVTEQTAETLRAYDNRFTDMYVATTGLVRQ